MSQSSIVARSISYIAEADQTVFDIPFEVFNTDEFLVVVAGDPLTGDLYSLTGDNAQVVLNSGTAAGDVVTLSSRIDGGNFTEYGASQPVTSQKLNRDFRYLRAAVSDLGRAVDVIPTPARSGVNLANSLLLGSSDGSAFEVFSVGDPDVRAGRYLTFAAGSGAPTLQQLEFADAAQVDASPLPRIVASVAGLGAYDANPLSVIMNGDVWTSDGTLGHDGDGDGYLSKDDALGRLFRPLARTVLTPDMFGVKSDGTDETAAMQRFLTALSETGLPGLWVTTVRADGQLFMGSDTHLTAIGGVLDNSQYTGGSGSLIGQSTLDTAIPLTADSGTADGGTGFTLSVDTATLPALGSRLEQNFALLMDDGEFSRFDVGTDDIVRKRQWVAIEAMGDGSLTLHGAPRYNYTVADNARLVPIVDLIQNIKIDGLTILGSETVIGGDNGRVGLRVDNGVDIYLDNIGVQHVSGSAVVFRGCKRFGATRNRHALIRSTGSGYGVAVLNECEDGLIDGNIGFSMRHASSAAASADADSQFYGICNNVFFSNSAVTGSAFTVDGAGVETGTTGGDALDFHGNCDNCGVIGAYIDCAAGSSLTYEGINPVITGVIVVSANVHGIYVTNRTIYPSVPKIHSRVMGWGNGQAFTGNAFAIYLLNGYASDRGVIRTPDIDLVVDNAGPQAQYALQVRTLNGLDPIEGGRYHIMGRMGRTGLGRGIYITGVIGAIISGNIDAADQEIIQVDDGSDLIFNFGGKTSGNIGMDLRGVSYCAGVINLRSDTSTFNGLQMDATCAGNRLSGIARGFNDDFSDAGTDNLFNGVAA